MILLLPFLLVTLLVVIALAVWALCAAAARADREDARRRQGEATITVHRVRRRSAGR